MARISKLGELSAAVTKKVHGQAVGLEVTEIENAAVVDGSGRDEVDVNWNVRRRRKNAMKPMLIPNSFITQKRWAAATW